MADNDSHLACSVCFQKFDSSQRRPWDIGCGHTFCEQCLRQHPRSFRYCPECRTRASNPHVNISLLRLVDAAATTSALGLGAPQDQQEQQAAAAASSTNNQLIPHHHQQQQQQQQQLPDAPPRGAIVPASGSSRSVIQAIQEATAAHTTLDHRGPHIPNSSSSIPQLLNAGSGGGSSGVLQTLRPGELHGSLDQHRAKIAQWRTSMWLYLTPLMGTLYVLSPLDIIPDIIPLIGWLDDLLVIVYVAFTVISILQQQNDRIRL